MIVPAKAVIRTRFSVCGRLAGLGPSSRVLSRKGTSLKRTVNCSIVREGAAWGLALRHFSLNPPTSAPYCGIGGGVNSVWNSQKPTMTSSMTTERHPSARIGMVSFLVFISIIVWA